MQISLVSYDEELARIRCEGEITQHNLLPNRDPVEDLVGPAIYRGRALLDLGPTAYIDSSGISYLLTVHKRFRQAGGRLVLHSVPPSVMQVFKLLKLPTVMHIAASEPEAERLATEAPV
jgi:anti-anti-sigma factor